MKYFFSKHGNIALTFGDVEKTCDGKEFIRICFEHAYSSGADFLESTLPALQVEIVSGFPDDLQVRLLDYARTNADLIWEIARKNAAKISDGG